LEDTAIPMFFGCFAGSCWDIYATGSGLATADAALDAIP
jgi:hypothetical protein